MKKGIYPLISSHKFINAVHPSGYTLSFDKSSSGIAGLLDPDSYMRKTVKAIDPNEEAVLKEVDLEEFYIEIYKINKSIKNIYDNRESFFESKAFIDLVNKYGLLTSLERFKDNIVINSEFINSLNEFLDPSKNQKPVSSTWTTLDKDKLDKKLITEESIVAKWHSVIEQASFGEARWDIQDDHQNFALREILIYKDKDAQFKLFAKSLNAALILFANQYNNPGVEQCENCDSLFVNLSRSKNQKFCKNSCRVSKYREETLNKNIQSLSSDYENLDFSKMKFRDIELGQIRINCDIHGTQIYKIEEFVENPYCSKCKK